MEADAENIEEKSLKKKKKHYQFCGEDFKILVASHAQIRYNLKTMFAFFWSTVEEEWGQTRAIDIELISPSSLKWMSMQKNYASTRKQYKSIWQYEWMHFRIFFSSPMRNHST